MIWLLGLAWALIFGVLVYVLFRIDRWEAAQQKRWMEREE